jgi:hypothetical protein
MTYLDPPAYTHYNTNNTSALKMYHILKQLGVKNCKFMLAIYDTDLMQVNPFDPALSPELQRRIHAEIVRNYWYYVREIVRINVTGGTSPFIFNRGNLALTWLLLKNINCYIELPRQTTKTGTVCARLAYIWAFGGINSKIALYCKDEPSIKDNLDRIKQVLNNFPPYLQMFNTKRDADNKEYIYSKASNNRITTVSAPMSEEQAYNRSRGSTEEIQWIDETAHLKFVNIIILNSGFSWQKARDFAKLNKVPYGRIFTSTPGILGTDKGDYIYYKFLPQCIKFDERLFYDQESLDSLKALILKESRNDFVYIRFTYKQLGMGRAYLEQQYRETINDIETIAREVLLLWARKSNDSPFTKEQLDKVFFCLKEPIGSLIIRNTYTLKLYKKPQPKKPYVISVDCSGMLNNDYASIAIIDPVTFELVATLRSNARSALSNTAIFTWAIIDIARDIYRESLIVIEKNNMGIAIVDNIVSLAPELTSRLYSSKLEPATRVKTKESLFSNLISNVAYDAKVVTFGFDTTMARRTQMFSEILGIVITELYDVVNDPDIFDELNNIIRNKQGRLEHRVGKHDDLLFAYLIGLWVLCYSRILEERYGFPFGYRRPMSIIEQDVAPDREETLKKREDMMDSLVDSALAIYSANYREPTNLVKPDNLVKEEPILDRNPSIADIGKLIFSDTESAIDMMDEVTEEFAIDTNPIDDIAHKLHKMNEADRLQFKQQQHFETSSYIQHLKQHTDQPFELAKNKKLKKELLRKKFITSEGKEGISESFLDSIITSYL